MSLHGAKGLSADAVVVPDLDDMIIPGDSDVEEQRRLMYVSMTRARYRLYLTQLFRSGATSYAGSGQGRQVRIDAEAASWTRRTWNPKRPASPRCKAGGYAEGLGVVVTDIAGARYVSRYDARIIERAALPA